jgi:hypothetical protein
MQSNNATAKRHNTFFIVNIVNRIVFISIIALFDSKDTKDYEKKQQFWMKRLKLSRFIW